MPIGDFDYKILTYISKVEKTTMESLCKKFGTRARSSVAELYKQGYLNWQPSQSSAFSHDDTSPITLSRNGTIEANNRREASGNARRSVWVDRIWGFVTGVIAGVVATLLTAYLSGLLHL